ncbi:STAS domain-containing protein [Paenibacillus sp. UNC451MF]|uniref:STAS domain-containing protein n=1 Tax=Paenibacillus sp. UNC451MF TaxID=1449063 RepID=UPI00068DA211|nr:STAS domain-containing protein [Paenibacillus sp. UNC451MF]
MSLRIRMDGQALIVDFAGAVDKHAEERYLQSRVWSQGLGEGRHTLILNFSEMSSIHSSGITMLIRLAQCGKEGGYQTFAYGLSEQYERLFRLIGITQNLMIYPDEYTLMRRLKSLEEIS